MTVLLMLACSGLVWAYEFEDYGWGIPMKKAEQMIQARNKIIIERGLGLLAYEDKIFGQDCFVNFVFTPETRMLVGVAVGWQAINKNVKDAIVQKYGSPTRSDESNRTYYWGSFEEKKQDVVLLTYSENTTILAYYCGKYRERLEKEMQQIKTAD